MSKLIVNQLQPYSGSLITFVDSTNVDIGGTLAVTGTGTFTGGIAGTLSTAAQTNITSVGTLSSLAVSGNLTVDTNTLFVDAANNRVGIGTSSPSFGFGGGMHLYRTSGSTLRVQDLYTDIEILAFTDGAYIQNRSNTFMMFTTNNVERMRIPAAGGLNIKDGNIAMSNGYGIDFSASAGGGATSSLLDDYEEGTFTPTITFGGASVGQGYNHQAGQYTKIGRQVTVTCYVEMNAKGSSTGAALVIGLPFVVASGVSYFSGITLSDLRNVSFADYPNGYAQNSQSYINLGETTNAGAFTALTDSNFANNSEFMITLTYFTN